MKQKTVYELLNWGIERLSDQHISTARLDAEVLLAYVIGKNRTWLYIEQKSEIDDKKGELYGKLIEKRVSKMPIGYIIGYKEFMSLDFLVSPSVLIPRPETEFLVEVVCNYGSAINNILEIGTGSGAIAVSLAKYNPEWRIMATDISLDALLIAKENSIRHKVKNIHFIQMNLFNGLSQKAKFDWIVSNPPYILTSDIDDLSDDIRKYEPIIALDGGQDGLNIIRNIINEAYKLLNARGKLAIEIGYGQVDDVIKITNSVGKYENYDFINDYAGISRVFYCQLKE